MENLHLESTKCLNFIGDTSVYGNVCFCIFFKSVQSQNSHSLSLQYYSRKCNLTDRLRLYESLPSYLHTHGKLYDIASFILSLSNGFSTLGVFLFVCLHKHASVRLSCSLCWVCHFKGTAHAVGVVCRLWTSLAIRIRLKLFNLT